jgi:hypothetical protein
MISYSKKAYANHGTSAPHTNIAMNNDDVRLFARAHTLTILQGCDANRKRVIVQFLYEACLIQKESPVVSLSYADLRDANLRDIPLTEGSSSGQENASLCARGVTEGLSGKPLDGKILLEILDVFGEEGLGARV